MLASSLGTTADYNRAISRTELLFIELDELRTRRDKTVTKELLDFIGPVMKGLLVWLCKKRASTQRNERSFSAAF